MSQRRPGFEGRYIVVADENRTIANVVIETLTADGHAVFLAYDGVSALELALGLKVCDLVISNSRIGGKLGVELIQELRDRLPWVPILYLANRPTSTPEMERGLPAGVRILQEPFGAEDLRRAVAPLLPDF
jgi:two-component system, response regulator FlrC